MVVPPPKQGDGTVAGVLHVLHGHNGQEMAGCQAVCRGIKTNIEGNFFLSQKIADLVCVESPAPGSPLSFRIS